MADLDPFQMGLDGPPPPHGDKQNISIQIRMSQLTHKRSHSLWIAGLFSWTQIALSGCMNGDRQVDCTFCHQLNEHLIAPPVTIKHRHTWTRNIVVSKESFFLANYWKWDHFPQHSAPDDLSWHTYAVADQWSRKSSSRLQGSRLVQGGWTLIHFAVLFITPEDMSPGMSHTHTQQRGARARAHTHAAVASQTGRRRNSCLWQGTYFIQQTASTGWGWRGDLFSRARARTHNGTGIVATQWENSSGVKSPNVCFKCDSRRVKRGKQARLAY